ncbi:MAG: hypothetical protein V1660_00310 [archaeon]
MPKSIQKETKKEKGKIPVTFNSEQLALIEKFNGVMGNTRAEVIRNIVINWLLQQKEVRQ